MYQGGPGSIPFSGSPAFFRAAPDDGSDESGSYLMVYEPYPRSLYRKVESGPPEHNFDGVQCEMLTVESEEQEAAAKAQGWHNSPAEAGEGTAAAPAAKPKSELAVLRAEYKALTGKNPSPKLKADELSEKIAALKAA